MQYINYYHSPLGRIVLSADEIGLTGLWFEGQKYFALYLDKDHEEKSFPYSKRQRSGSTSTFRAESRISNCPCILSARPFKMRFGKSSAPFRTAKL